MSKMGFLFPFGEKVSESYAYPFGYFLALYNDIIQTIVSFCIFKNLTLLNFERGADLGRSWLVLFTKLQETKIPFGFLVTFVEF